MDAGGERIADSIVRRAMLKKSGSIDPKRGRFYPLAHFNKAEVERYVAARRLKMAPEYKVLGYSFRSLDPHDMVRIREHFPADFALIKKYFPFVEAGCVRYETGKGTVKDQVSEIRDADHAAVGDPGGGV